MQEAAARSNC